MQNYYNKKLQKIGWYDRKKFRKVVSKDKHLLRVMDAWGIEAYVVNDLKRKKCEQIRIKETVDNLVYIVDFKEFVEKGVTRNFGSEQVFLPRKYFKTIRA